MTYGKIKINQSISSSALGEKKGKIGFWRTK